MTLLTKLLARLGPESADGNCSHIKALSCSDFREKKCMLPHAYCNAACSLDFHEI